jgi:hypothetical protein
METSAGRFAHCRALIRISDLVALDFVEPDPSPASAGSRSPLKQVFALRSALRFLTFIG